jgi:transcriptional regulator with XRE-family HTH domain
VTPPQKTFGETVRELRKKKGISLRRFAQKVDMSPTYLSKVERGEFKPPAEEKVMAIASALGEDPDELLALAGRVPSDVQDIIKERPREMASFLRAARKLPPEEINRLTQDAEKRKRAK